jgi:glycosyltransferase involved in cell wall biosynthesis
MQIPVNLLLVVSGGIHQWDELKSVPVMLALTKIFAQKNNVCILLLSQHQKLTEYTINNCHVVSLPIGSHRNIFWSQRIAALRLKALDFSPDVVHSFRLGSPTLLAAALARRYRAPLIASAWGGEFSNLPQIGYGSASKLPTRVVVKASRSMANVSTYGSQYLKDLATKIGFAGGLVVPLGIDTSFWELIERNDELPNCWNLLHVGSINKVKNPWLMLAIVKELKKRSFNFKLHWVGCDTLNGLIQSEAKSSGLDKDIIFYGLLTQDSLKKLMQDQHFFLQTSLHESQGIAITEAASQGICPVGTNVGWLNDLNIGFQGSSCTASECIASEIIRLSHDGHAKKARVNLAQSWIRENTAQHSVQKFLHIYSDALKCQISN